MIPPSVISPLPKKDTDPLECPVSLLNTDVKILAKVLARHLETVAPEMISPDQTVFIKSCYLFFTIRHLFNILYNLPPSTGVNCEWYFYSNLKKRLIG